jgi:hypothetical protein
MRQQRKATPIVGISFLVARSQHEQKVAPCSTFVYLLLHHFFLCLDAYKVKLIEQSYTWTFLSAQKEITHCDFLSAQKEITHCDGKMKKFGLVQPEVPLKSDRG